MGNQPPYFYGVKQQKFLKHAFSSGIFAERDELRRSVFCESLVLSKGFTMAVRACICYLIQRSCPISSVRTHLAQLLTGKENSHY